MRVVVDLGCKNWGGEDESLNKLIDRFHPDLYFGFDPHPEITEGVTRIGDTTVIICNKAAWISCGTQTFRESGISSRVINGGSWQVETFDVSSFLRSLPECELIVKMDMERAEYPVLGQLLSDGTHERIDKLLIEWHGAEHIGGIREWVENW